jgi:hypothetical protein
MSVKSNFVCSENTSEASVFFCELLGEREPFASNPKRVLEVTVGADIVREGPGVFAI